MGSESSEFAKSEAQNAEKGAGRLTMWISSGRLGGGRMVRLGG